MRFLMNLGLFLVVLGVCSAALAECQEEQGMHEAEEGHYKEAFFLLKNCEGLEGTSGAALGALAYLYAILYEELGLSGREVEAKIYNLSLRGALKGDPESLADLRSSYRTGLSEIGLEPNLSIVDCLNGIDTPDNKYSTQDVERCLNLNAN